MNVNTPRYLICTAAVTIALLAASHGQAGELDKLAAALVFHAPFDGTCQARVAAGDGEIYTADSTARQNVQRGNQREDVRIVSGSGLYGDALRFEGSSKEILFYPGRDVALPSQNWSATFSFWLKLNPDKDLAPGYCDPFQMTDKKWNDAAIFVDFDKELPRDFRLGVFSDYGRWNPYDIAWEDFPVEHRPMVTVKSPPFDGDTWTHVAFTLSRVNPEDANTKGTASLYLNGELQGSLEQPLHLTWDASKAALMVGIQYIGDFDDLAVFNRALTASEIQQLRALPRGVSQLKADE